MSTGCWRFGGLLNTKSMKLLYLLLPVLFFAAPKVTAQGDYLPTAVEGANWIIRDSETPLYPYLTFVRFIEGDTTVSERTYKKLYERTIDYLDTPGGPQLAPPYTVLPGRRLIALLRDETTQRRVYGMVSNSNVNGGQFYIDTLLHDYSLEVSDTLLGRNFDSGQGALVITTTGTVDRFGGERRFQAATDLKFYEGVGSMEFGPVSGGSDFRTGCCIFLLHDYCVGDFSDCGLVLSPTTELSREMSIETYPNPFTSQLNIIPSEIQAGPPILVSLRDVTGRLLEEGLLEEGLQWSTEELASGMYIVTFTSDARSATVKLMKQ